MEEPIAVNSADDDTEKLCSIQCVDKFYDEREKDEGVHRRSGV